MRLSKEALAMRVIVRRVQSGARPFKWEIHGAESAAPPVTSADRFATMEAAFQAGQARLEETVPALKSFFGPNRGDACDTVKELDFSAAA